MDLHSELSRAFSRLKGVSDGSSASKKLPAENVFLPFIYKVLTQMNYFQGKFKSFRLNNVFHETKLKRRNG